MRPYQPKHDVQKQSYYTDRFWVSPCVPRQEVATSPEFSQDLEQLSAQVKVKEAYIEIGQMVIVLDSHKDNFKALQFARDSLGYDILSEMSAMDYLEKRRGFELFYQMLSLSTTKRIRIKCFLPEGLAIETVEPLFRSADFAEREMYDMFGIVVNNHPYLKRILMPDDWVGHPLLKSYPLEGDEHARWYEVDKIFGKEYRDVIGPENRDPARIDRYDTENFSRIGHEVGFGEDISNGEPETKIQYQEEKSPLLINQLKPEKSKQLKERR